MKKKMLHHMVISLYSIIQNNNIEDVTTTYEKEYNQEVILFALKQTSIHKEDFNNKKGNEINFNSE